MVGASASKVHPLEDHECSRQVGEGPLHELSLFQAPEEVRIGHGWIGLGRPMCVRR